MYSEYLLNDYLIKFQLQNHILNDMNLVISATKR